MIPQKKHILILSSLVFAPLSQAFLSFAAYADSIDNMQIEAADFTDSQIAGVISVADEVVISTGNLAIKNANNPKVVDFAKTVVKEHERFAAEFNGILNKASVQGQDSATSLGLRAEGVRDLATLKMLKGAEFDREYLHQQIKFEEHLVALLDSSLIPSTKSVDIKNYLTAMRLDILKLVAKAKALQAEIGE